MMNKRVVSCSEYAPTQSCVTDSFSADRLETAVDRYRPVSVYGLRSDLLAVWIPALLKSFFDVSRPWTNP